MITRDIESFIIPESGREFPGDDVRLMLKPCVYLFMKGKQPLYIGFSGNGLQRPFSPKHRSARKAQAECDRMLVWFCETEENAKRLESTLLGRIQSTYNKTYGRKVLLRALLGNS